MKKVITATKEFTREALEKSGEYILFGLVGVVYLIVGLLIAIPYHYLAHGTTPEQFVLTMVVAPISTLMWLMFWWLPTLRKTSYVLAIYLCLPIILNGYSLIIGLLGYGAVSQLIFNIRYAILLGIVLACLLMVYVMAGFYWARNKLKSWKTK